MSFYKNTQIGWIQTNTCWQDSGAKQWPNEVSAPKQAVLMTLAISSKSHTTPLENFSITRNKGKSQAALLPSLHTALLCILPRFLSGNNNNITKTL